MQIAKLFSTSSTLYLLNRGGVSQISPSFHSGEGLYLIASELCLFSVQNLSEVPNALRENFLLQRSLQISPFRSTAHYVHIVGDEAQLWVWDKDLESEVSQDINVRFIPEQLMLPIPDSRFCIRSDAQRYQLEYWRNGLLHAIKTYLLAPDENGNLENNCANFIAAYSIDDNGISWVDSSFSYMEFARDEAKPLTKEWFAKPKVLTFSAAVISVIFLSGFVGNYLGWQYLVSTKRSQVEQGSSDIQPLIELREQALGLQKSNQQISLFFEYAPVIELAAEFEQSVGAYYDELIEWNFDAGSLTVLLLDQSGNSRKYIEALSASELFQEVSASPGIRPDSVMIQMKVVSGISRNKALGQKRQEVKDISGEAS